ncbi:MAG: hypothetical protein J6T84_09115 [Spirochaetaceae bacterium]|nr:hypothetical protein [Spirochaetaceae bacterium]
MTKLEISDNFTVDDIHKVREYNYEHTKNMSEEERSNYYKTQAETFLKSAGIVPTNRMN